MSYADDYALMMSNLDFRGRVSMCIAEQAKVFVADGRDIYKNLANAAIQDNATITTQFLPLVVTQPDMDDESTDGELLAAVQYLWPTVGAGYVS